MTYLQQQSLRTKCHSKEGQTMELAEFLTHFQGVKRSGTGYKALCPAHSDKKASLCISQGEKGIVMKCQCGCDNNDILKKVCLDMTDLFPDKQQRKEKIHTLNINQTKNNRQPRQARLF